jgi:pimeloyl-ACP methyl ester carboxylesterase
MPSAPPPAVVRRTVDVAGLPASYLTAGSGATLLMLHGTYWSRVWLPVLEHLAKEGVQPVAVDLPGCGRSGGELSLTSATVPALATWVTRFVDALGPVTLAGVAGHDIGGAIAQHLLVASDLPVERMALVNSVTYDSWPVPGVARYRDPAVVAAVTVADILSARRQAITAALARPADEDELRDYLSPWTDLRVARSWTALAGAADSRYTLDLLDALRADTHPKLLIWGVQDSFQPVTYAERFAAEIPNTSLVRVPAAGHIPMENRPTTVAHALVDFIGGRDGSRCP